MAIKLKQIDGGLSLKSDVTTIQNTLSNYDEVVDGLELLNGGSEVEGSVANMVAGAKEELEEKIEGETTFEAGMVTVNALGGITANTNLDGLTTNEVLKKLLFPHVNPTISASSTPNGGTFEYGNVQTVTTLTANVTKKSEKITKIEFFNNAGTSVGALTDGVENGGSKSLTGLSEKVSTNGYKFTAKATDALGNVVSANTGTFTFVYPYYYGVCADDAVITADLVSGLTKNVAAKGAKTFTYTCDFQRMVFAYPKAHGKLSKIVDPNGFDVTSTYNCTEVAIVGLDGTSQNYYVYALGAGTTGTFKMTFNH